MPASTASSPAVDLSALPAPVIVPQPSFEARLAGKLAGLIAAHPAFDALVESDPAMKLLQSDSFDEMVLAQAFSDAARGMLLAYATGELLDQLAALYDVARLVVTPAEGDTPAVLESDTAFRQRIQLAPHAFSVAGPELAYVYHARSAHGDVADATAVSPTPADITALVLQVLADNAAAPELVAAMSAALGDADWPGDVTVTVLSASGDGVPSPEVLTAVDTLLQADVRPLTDQVTVQAAELVDFAIEAEIYVFAGPDQNLILQTALASLEAHLANTRRLGRDIARSGLIAALHVGNVQRVNLIQPAADIAITSSQIGHPTDIAVTIAGTEL